MKVEVIEDFGAAIKVGAILTCIDIYTSLMGNKCIIPKEHILFEGIPFDNLKLEDGRLMKNLSQDEIDQLIKDLNNQYGQIPIDTTSSQPLTYNIPINGIYGYRNTQKNHQKDDQLSFGLNSPEPKKIVCECGAEKTHGNNSGHSSWCPKASK